MNRKPFSGRKTDRINKARTHRSAGDSTLAFENLEVRQLLAFDFLFDGTTLTLNQTVDDGIVQIDNSGAANEFQVNDGAGFVTYEAATNVEINLLDNSNHMTLSLNQTHAGDLTINAGDGMRSIIFASPGNDIDGNLRIRADAGQQTLSLAHISMLEVGGTVNIDTGDDSDALNFVHPLRVGADLTLLEVNDIHFGDSLHVGNNVFISSVPDLERNIVEKSNAMPSSIVGDFTFRGNTLVDRIILQDLIIGGDIDVDLETGSTGGAATQLFSLSQVEFNNLDLRSGDSTNPDFNSWNGVVAHGNVLIDMGEGFNSSFVEGTIEGSSFTYTGLGDVDIVGYDMSGGAGQNLSFSLGEGMDNFTLFDGSTVNDLHVDFGGPDDIFNNGVGDFTFDARLINLDGFDIEYDLASDSLSVTQRTDGIFANLELHSDVVSERFSYDTNELTSASNLNIQMNDNNPGGLDVYLEHLLGGNLTVDLGDGPRMVEFLGGMNAVKGNLHIVGGADSQTVIPDTNAPLVVTGDLVTVDLGEGQDTLSALTHGMLLQTSVELLGINTIDFSAFVEISGDLSIDTSMEVEASVVEINQQMIIDGDLTLNGGDGRNVIQYNPAMISEVLGNVLIDLGDNTLPGSQVFTMNSATRFQGDVTVRSTNEATLDLIASEAGSIVAGNVLIDFGNGTNIGNFRHDVTSDSLLKFVSGSGNDEVFLSTSGVPSRFNIIMGEGNDIFNLEAPTNIGDMLRVDFGGGNDTFNNNKGVFAWDTRLLNFHGFSSFYDSAADSLRVVQVADLGNVALDNTGFANSIQVDVQGVAAYELTPVTNLRLEMMPNTTGDVAIQLDSPMNGDLILNMQHGDRDAFFIGTNNRVSGDLRIVAGDGTQNLYLAENSDLIVLGETVINTRDGVDAIIDGGNKLDFDSNLFLRNVDDFEVSNSLFVGGNMNMVSHWYTQDVRFDNDGSIQVDGKLTYLGSDGMDDLLLSGNVTIGDEVYIALGDNVSAGPGQDVDLSNGFEALDRVAIQAGTSIGGNNVTTDATSRIGGDFIVDFTGSATSNTAILHGTYGGGYGTFRGGQAGDVLLFDAVAEDMAWATLMFDGNDEVSLGANTNVLSKYLDLGFGNDILDDTHVTVFPMTVVNLP